MRNSSQYYAIRREFYVSLFMANLSGFHCQNYQTFFLRNIQRVVNVELLFEEVSKSFSSQEYDIKEIKLYNCLKYNHFIFDGVLLQNIDENRYFETLPYFYLSNNYMLKYLNPQNQTCNFQMCTLNTHA